MGCLVTRTKRHVKTTDIIAEEYLRNEISKKSPPETEDKFINLVDHVTKLYEHNHSKRHITIESKGTPIMKPVLLQSLRNAGKNNKKHQSGNKTR